MDRSAIDAIGELALRADGIRTLDTNTPTIILHGNDGETIVSLEKYKAGRARYRGHYTTTNLPSFVETVIDTTGDKAGGFITTSSSSPIVGTATNITDCKASGFIDSSTMTAVVYFNLGDVANPGHGDHLASLTLKKTAAYSALLLATSRPHTQRTLAEWVEDWREFLTPVSGGKPTGDTLARVCAAIRDITVTRAREVNKVERDMGAASSAMASVDAKSQHVLPEGFLFETEPYAGLPARTFELRLGVVTNDDDIKLTLRIQQAESVGEKIAKDFETVLTQGLGDKVSLSIGTFNL